jgi:hypothetical protein
MSLNLYQVRLYAATELFGRLTELGKCPPERESRHIEQRLRRVIVRTPKHRRMNLETVDQLLQRQAELESAMRQLGGARITEEQELQLVKRKLAAISERSAAKASAIALRCSLADFLDVGARPGRKQTT